jgi:hypothetical protein
MMTRSSVGDYHREMAPMMKVSALFHLLWRVPPYGAWHRRLKSDRHRLASYRMANKLT